MEIAAAQPQAAAKNDGPTVAMGFIALIAAALLAKNWSSIMKVLSAGKKTEDPEVAEEKPVIPNFECLDCGMVIYPAPQAAIAKKFIDLETMELRDDFVCTNPKCKAPKDRFIKKLPRRWDPSMRPPTPASRQPEASS